MIAFTSFPLMTIIICTSVGFYLLFQSSRSISLYVRRRRFKEKNGCQPLVRNFPHKDPFCGVDLIYANLQATREKRFLETLCKRYQSIGTTFGAKVLGQHVIFTSEPENIKSVLSIRFQDFSLGNRPKIMGVLLGKGISTTDGKDWAHARAMLRPSLIKEQVADLQAFESHIENLFKLIPRDGSTVDLQPLFFRFTLDSATEFLFGHSVRSLRDSIESDQNFGDAFNYSLGELCLRFRLGPFWVFRRNKKASEAFTICRAYVDQFVEKAIQHRHTYRNKAPEPDGGKLLFLQELAKATDSKERIRDELLNILIAGRDTTASLLSHALFEISREPHVWKALREEISVLGGKPPTYDQLKDLKYLKYTIQETLRLHPPVPTNNRLCVKDTVLPLGGGRFSEDPVFVAEGTILVYTVHAMHRRKDFFGEDANEFRPERWVGQRHSWEYLPFNGGPRICLGQQYALMEVSYVLIRMLQEYKTLEARDSQPWTESLTLTVCSENGVKVGVTPARAYNMHGEDD